MDLGSCDASTRTNANGFCVRPERVAVIVTPLAVGAPLSVNLAHAQYTIEA